MQKVSASAIALALVAAGARPLCAQSITFNKDVAPILRARCATCHRPGEIGPFSLLSFRDAKQHVTQIADVTARRAMPPWKPQPGGVPFLDDRSLSAAELGLIQDWIKQGAVEGDPRDLAPVPELGGGWQLGTPDLIVSMPDSYLLQASGSDVFRTFVLPIPTGAARYVRAIEFHPGNPRAVHHTNIGIDRTRSSRRLDLRDPEPGYSGGMVPDAAYPPGQMLGWTPGQRPRPSPEGTAWRLERDSDLVVQLHLQPTGKPEPVQVSVGFFFSDRPPVQLPVGLRLGSETIDIRPGDRNYVVTDSYVLPVDANLLAIQPHAHNLGRRMEAAAMLPDGTTRSLISIVDWDFRWQDVYRCAQPVALPKGTTITMRFTYDNSAENARNPHRPPQRVVWGQNTADEMGDLWVQLIARLPADAARLSEDVNRKRRDDDLAAYTKLLRDDPMSPLRHDAVAMLYLQGGQADEAASQYRESLKLNPESAPAHYNLGLALSMQRRFDAARSEFQEAVRLDPEYAEAHNNLGAMLHVFGRLDEAADHYRRAAAIRPDNAEAQNNLGRVLTQQGRQAEAVDHFHQAIALNPDFVSALSGLAWVRATSDASLLDAGEAVRLGERADALTDHKDPAILDALAAAYAAAGTYDRAIATAKLAVQLATAAQMSNLAAEAGQRLALYERHQPYLARP